MADIPTHDASFNIEMIDIPHAESRRIEGGRNELPIEKVSFVVETITRTHGVVDSTVAHDDWKMDDAS